jgi:hypothetical protein
MSGKTVRTSMGYAASIVSVGLPSGIFPSCFPTKILYEQLLSPIRATCSSISFFSILSSEQYLVRSAGHKAPHYVIFLFCFCFFVCSSKQTFLERALRVLLFCKTTLVVFRMGVKLGLTLRAGYRLWVFENRVLRRICGSNRDEVTGECEYVTRSLMICTAHRMLFGWSNQE